MQESLLSLLAVQTSTCWQLPAVTNAERTWPTMKRSKRSTTSKGVKLAVLSSSCMSNSELASCAGEGHILEGTMPHSFVQQSESESAEELYGLQLHKGQGASAGSEPRHPRRLAEVQQGQVRSQHCSADVECGIDRWEAATAKRPATADALFEPAQKPAVSWEKRYSVSSSSSTTDPPKSKQMHRRPSR